MARLIYDVAASLDGYIAGPNNAVAAFPHAGDHVDLYTERLKHYGTVVMGRNTYEFAYAYGLKPGELAYAGMDHIVVSSTISLPDASTIRVVRDIAELLEAVDHLKATSESDIYLCGGGQLAGHLLANNCIDRLHIKLAPVLLGGGTPLFEGIEKSFGMSLKSAIPHLSGVTTLTYDMEQS